MISRSALVMTTLLGTLLASGVDAQMLEGTL